MASLGSRTDAASLATDLPNIFRQMPPMQIFTNVIACTCVFFVLAIQSAILLEAYKVLICKVNMAF